jgi:hypothetical protein
MAFVRFVPSWLIFFAAAGTMFVRGHDRRKASSTRRIGGVNMLV